MLNTILLSMALLVFTAYWVYIYIKFGIQFSLSDSYYQIKHKIIFTLVLWIVSFCLIIVASTPLMFFAGTGIAFVGAAASFRDGGVTLAVHGVGAIGGILMGFISVWVDYHLWYVSVFMVVFSLLLLFIKAKNYVWWIETMAFLLIFLTLIIKKIIPRKKK